MTYIQTRGLHEFYRGGTGSPGSGQLDIELTERCNNACIHCLINQPVSAADVQAREMDTLFVEDILRQAAALGCLVVRFTGGEPLLREDFAHLYLFARRLGMEVILFTNARRVTPELAQLLARIPPRRRVEVSVYGMQAASYDAAASAPGAFAEFWRGVNLLREYGIPFIVKQSLLPPNRHETGEVEAWAATLPGMDQPPGYIMNFSLRARRDNPAKNRLIQSLRFTPQETVTALARNPGYVGEMREFAGKFMGPPGERLFNCGAGRSVCIDAYGKAQMCLELRHPDTVYDLRRAAPGGGAPLRYALAEFFPRLRELCATDPDYLGRCARCFLKGLCEQCPAKSWTEHGRLDQPVDYLCAVAHAQARYLGLLNETECAWELTSATWRKRMHQFTQTKMIVEEEE